MFSTKFDESHKLWYGGDIPVEHKPKISLGQALLNSMRVFGSKVAQVKWLMKLRNSNKTITIPHHKMNDSDGIQLTFDEMRTKTIRVAQNLQARGCQQNQVIGILAENHTNLAPIAFASIAIGCAICPLPFDPAFEKEELVEMLKITKPALMFCDVKYCEMLNECLIELGNKAKIFVFGDNQDRFEHVDDLFEKTHKENQFS